MDAIDRLHLSLESRLTPEATAALVLEAIGTRMLPIQRTLLARAADSPAAMYTSMGDDFTRPTPLTHKVRMLAELGILDQLDEQGIAVLAADPWRLLGQLAIAARFNGWDAGADFKHRRNRKMRGGMQISGRRYNRVVRLLARTRDAAWRMKQQILLRHLILVSRAGLAPTITVAEMRADPDAAAFVAYLTAMRKRRRAFTLAGRDNPMDSIAQMLLTRCEIRPGTDWWMIARAYPRPQVVARLGEQHRGEMLGGWSGYMQAAAGILKDLYEAWPSRTIPPTLPDDAWAARPDLMPSREARGARTEPVVNLKTMVVNAGVDLSTWNAAAAGYNAARDGWISCLTATGALGLLQVACPGKVMRLMAGDLQAWHLAAEGSAAHPDTAVWARLPLPWRVLAGEQECPAELVEQVCSEEGVDAHDRGWVGPRADAGAVAAWKPTDELVHGIVVHDPLWAGLLRQAGVWSGKTLADDAGQLLGEYRKSTVTAS